MADSTIPQASRDWLNDYSDRLLGAGLEALKGATGQTQTEPDTVQARQAQSISIKTIAIAAAVVLGIAFAVRFLMKR